MEETQCCLACGRALAADEIALTRKLVNRGAEGFWCLTCLAVRFGVSEQRLQELAAHYRAQGCTLFER